GVLLHFALRVEEIDFRKTAEVVICDRELALPDGLTTAAAVFGALPKNSHAAAEIGGSVGPCSLNHLGAVQNVDALDRRGADHFGMQLHWRRAWADDVAHPRLADPVLGGRAERGV